MTRFQPAGRVAGGERPFCRGHLIGVQEKWLQLRELSGQARGLVAGGIGIGVQQHQSDRRSREVELGTGPGQATVSVQAVVVEGGQDGVERVLNHAQVAAGGAGADGGGLEERDAEAALGEHGGRRAADDPGPDDGDLGQHARQATIGG